MSRKCNEKMKHIVNNLHAGSMRRCSKMKVQKALVKEKASKAKGTQKRFTVHVL